MIRHVLFDADGVVQRVGGDGWRARVTHYLGDRTDEFVATLAELEAPALTGNGDFTAGLVRTLAEFGVDADPDEVYEGVWLAMETLPDTVALVRSLRRTGRSVHLVTNQHARRASHMKQRLRYDEVFDSCFYSCDLGLAKPDPAFFTRVAQHVGGAPGELLLVDDSPTNVAGARAAGLSAEFWHHDEGLPALRARLAAHGVTTEHSR